MPRKQDRIIRQCEYLLCYAVYEVCPVTAGIGEIPYAVAEYRITNKGDLCLIPRKTLEKFAGSAPLRKLSELYSSFSFFLLLLIFSSLYAIIFKNECYIQIETFGGKRYGKERRTSRLPRRYNRSAYRQQVETADTAKSACAPVAVQRADEVT